MCSGGKLGGCVIFVMYGGFFLGGLALNSMRSYWGLDKLISALGLFMVLGHFGDEFCRVF